MFICSGGVSLWEGFWNSFLLGQTCEAPTTARETTLEHLYAYTTRISLFVAQALVIIRLFLQEQNMAYTNLADLTILEILWLWVAPAYLLLEVFIFGKGFGMVSFSQTCEAPPIVMCYHTIFTRV